MEESQFLKHIGFELPTNSVTIRYVDDNGEWEHKKFPSEYEIRALQLYIAKNPTEVNKFFITDFNPVTKECYKMNMNELGLFTNDFCSSFMSACDNVEDELFDFTY